MQRQTLTLVPKPAHSAPMPDTAQRIISSQHLLCGSKVIAIAHNGTTYQLRATKFGKLILDQVNTERSSWRRPQGIGTQCAPAV